MYLFRNAISIKWEWSTSCEVARMPPRWKLVCIIPWRETAVCGDVMPLKQYKITAHSLRKLEPVTIVPQIAIYACTVTCLRSRRHRRNVGTLGIIWVGVGAFCRYEPQLVCIKAGLCSYPTRQDRTRLEYKVPLVVRCQRDLDVDCLPAIVCSLDPWTTPCIIIIPNIASATCFCGSFCVETMGTPFLLFYSGDPVTRSG